MNSLKSSSHLLLGLPTCLLVLMLVSRPGCQLKTLLFHLFSGKEMILRAIRHFCLLRQSQNCSERTSETLGHRYHQICPLFKCVSQIHQIETGERTSSGGVANGIWSENWVRRTGLLMLAFDFRHPADAFRVRLLLFRLLVSGRLCLVTTFRVVTPFLLQMLGWGSWAIGVLTHTKTASLPTSSTGSDGPVPPIKINHLEGRRCGI